jgi:hypothetical protein
LSLLSGERQVAPDRSGIRRDHVARYEFALTRLPRRTKVIDLACGVGYGSDMMAQSGHHVIGIDRDSDAIGYARRHYAGAGARFKRADASSARLPKADAAVCFETIEHLADPLPMLRSLRKAAQLLIASVPNETVFPFRNYTFHHRHYTRAQFEALLAQAGWQVIELHGQAGPQSEVEPEIEGRTLVAVAKPAKAKRTNKEPVVVQPAVPEHVCIIGLGPSASTYLDLVKRFGDRRAYADEVWAINGMGSVLSCDRVFHMDDLQVQEGRARLNPTGNIAAMVNWLKRHPGPVYTSVVRPGYPGLVAFPLEDVLNGNYDKAGAPYFNNTAAYAIAFAIHIGVKRISLYGIDFTYPNAHQAEQGRACCEYWLGVAASRGIVVTIPESTTLLDACAPDRDRLYGYDCVDVILHDREDGGLSVRFDPRADIPSAEEIERRYDHAKHPNRLVRGGD